MEIANTIEKPNRLGHIMVDLETMGRNSNAVICSIGAVEFDINTGQTGREFFAKVDIQSCPIDDCKNQIEYCVAIWQKLNKINL